MRVIGESVVVCDARQTPLWAAAERALSKLETTTAARGADFDRAYLRLMIQHHVGALKMVDDLFTTSLAGQEVDVNVFANDVVTVQTGEIGIMRRLLKRLPAK